MPGASWELHETDVLVTIRTPVVRVVFRRAEDRWTHEIGPVDGPPLVASLESPAEQPDPTPVLSPLYQEVQHHAADDDERRVRLLLTGLLHRHHFSAVLTVVADSAGGSVEFDVADRCRDTVSSLAATYDLRLGLPGPDGSANVATWDGALGETGLSLEAKHQGALALLERGPRALQAQVLAKLEPGSFTHRLRYRWTWTTPTVRRR